MKRKESKGIISNILIFVLFIGLIATVGTGLAKDKRTVENNKVLKSAYEEELKKAEPAAEIETEKKTETQSNTKTNTTTKSTGTSTKTTSKAATGTTTSSAASTTAVPLQRAYSKQYCSADCSQHNRSTGSEHIRKQHHKRTR